MGMVITSYAGPAEKQARLGKSYSHEMELSRNQPSRQAADSNDTNTALQR